MKTIFASGPSYILRLSFVIAFCIILLIADSQFNIFTSVRVYLNSIVSPIQYVADAPQKIFSAASESLTTRQVLMQRNELLEKENLHLKADRLLLGELQNENKELRGLLNSKRQFKNKRMITEVMSLRSDPFTHQVLIDKGALDGVYLDQPVINDKGVIGQVSQVGSTTSRVVLIVDASHGIPVRVQRNDAVAIVHGSGAWDKLIVPFVQNNADIREGDILVTSGLGGHFPAGYPVATVSRFAYQEGEVYAEVTATPTAALDKSRYLLLLWNDDPLAGADLTLDSPE